MLMIKQMFDHAQFSRSAMRISIAVACPSAVKHRVSGKASWRSFFVSPAACAVVCPRLSTPPAGPCRVTSLAITWHCRRSASRRNHDLRRGRIWLGSGCSWDVLMEEGRLRHSGVRAFKPYGRASATFCRRRHCFHLLAAAEEPCIISHVLPRHRLLDGLNVCAPWRSIMITIFLPRHPIPLGSPSKSRLALAKYLILSKPILAKRPAGLP